MRTPLLSELYPPPEAAAVTGAEPPASLLVSCQPTRPFPAFGHFVLHQQNSSRKETRSEGVGRGRGKQTLPCSRLSAGRVTSSVSPADLREKNGSWGSSSLHRGRHYCLLPGEMIGRFSRSRDGRNPAEEQKVKPDPREKLPWCEYSWARAAQVHAQVAPPGLAPCATGKPYFCLGTRYWQFLLVIFWGLEISRLDLLTGWEVRAKPFLRSPMVVEEITVFMLH